MQKFCVICGKSFECNRNKLTCGPACQKLRRNQTSREYNRTHKEQVQAITNRWIENNKEKYNEYQKEYSKKRWANRGKTATKNKPSESWIAKYEKADRLTKLSMMQLALTEHNISSINYGYLSFIYGTDEYKRLEEKVYKAKEAL